MLRKTTPTKTKYKDLFPSAAASSASAIGDKCAACKAVAVSSLYSFSFFLEFIGA
jgi:hypothetical protein